MAKKLKLKFDLIRLSKKITSDKKKLAAIQKSLQDRNLRVEIGKRFIDEVLRRTNSGIDKRGVEFVKYSESYKKSLAFKVYNKTEKVNLKLSGQMQASIDVVNVDGKSITVAFLSDTQNDKAHGHVFGGGHLPIRDFWGLPEDDQIKIMKQAIKEHSEKRTIFF